MKFATIALIGATQAAKIRGDDNWGGFPPQTYPTPWDKDSLPACPEDPTRRVLDDGWTEKVKWPYVGANCALQLGDDVTLVMLGSEAKPSPKPESPTAAPSLDHLEHCPDFNERYTLRNGRDLAIPYPRAGFNCNPAWSLAQAAPAYNPPAGLEHCPDRPERQTLRNGTTRAVPYPSAGFNCVPDIYPG